MVKPEQINIRQLQPDDSLEQLTELLHRAYKQLADMGLKYVATYQPVDTTAKRIKDGVCFVAEFETRIVATLTYYPPGLAHAARELNITDCAWVGQMGVEPPLQRYGIGLKLLDFVEDYARQKGAQRMGLDTSEKAQHLIDWYTKLGYQFRQYLSWDITNYRSVILVKEL